MSELRRITERYRLDKQVAASDAGSVFRATDIQSGATVAVKLINSDGGESEEQRERFLTTAGVFQSLHHPALPRVFDFGFTTAGSAFLVTEFLHGSGFEEVAGSAPGRVLTLLIQVVDSLEAMGAQGISTRNLRTENLLVVPGEGGEQVKILGLGSAVLEPGAMPVLDGYPEDLRAFGLLACRMLRVQTDFRVGIPLEVAVELEDIEALRALLEAALHGDPERHYPSWTEVREALRSALSGQTGARGMARTEAFATHPGLKTDGARLAPAVPPQRGDDLDSTMMVAEPEPLAPPPAESVPQPPVLAELARTVEIPRVAVQDVMGRPVPGAAAPPAQPPLPVVSQPPAHAALPPPPPMPFVPE
ncbi:MAG TPA: protein kinase, partial [Thermoanaerobaculia bacterium]